MFLVLLANLFVLAIAQTNPNGCGKRPAIGSTIVGGTVAPAGSWPWMVSVNYGGGHTCGGTLINSKWVMTAAHCITTTTLTRYRVYLGTNDITALSGTTVIRIPDTIIVHSAFNSMTFENDIALIRLGMIDLFYDNYVQPACLPTANDDLTGKDTWASGWGTTYPGGTLSSQHREVKVPITSDADCTSFYGSLYRPTSMICAGTVGGNADACQGDSGGPLSYKDPATGLWQVVGITSWGFGCGDIGVYTRVANYKKWIDDTIKANN